VWPAYEWKVILFGVFRLEMASSGALLKSTTRKVVLTGHRSSSCEHATRHFRSRLQLIQIYACQKTCNEAFGTYIFPNIYHASCTHMCVINDNSSLRLYAYIRVFIELLLLAGRAGTSGVAAGGV